MADRTKDSIEQLIDRVFLNRKENENRVLSEKLSEHLTDVSQRGVRQSGMFYSNVGRIHGEYLSRVLDQTFEQLEHDFRAAGRKDGTFFWNVVEAKLTTTANNLRTTLNNTAIDYCKSHGGISANESSIVAQAFSRIGDHTNSTIRARVSELRLRSKFITMKSPEDRKTNNIPDVAVMMWFPDEKAYGIEAVTRSKEKYQAIVDSVNEASKGLATVGKIDDPTLVLKDRISPEVETWLSKSVLVICDLEGNRANVFYEFGYARAIGTDVIAISPAGQKTEFHLAQWHIDSYSDMPTLKNKITPRIQTVLSNYDLSGNSQ